MRLLIVEVERAHRLCLVLRIAESQCFVQLLPCPREFILLQLLLLAEALDELLSGTPATVTAAVAAALAPTAAAATATATATVAAATAAGTATALAATGFALPRTDSSRHPGVLFLVSTLPTPQK